MKHIIFLTLSVMLLSVGCTDKSPLKFVEDNKNTAVQAIDSVAFVQLANSYDVQITVFGPRDSLKMILDYEALIPWTSLTNKVTITGLAVGIHTFQFYRDSSNIKSPTVTEIFRVQAVSGQSLAPISDAAFTQVSGTTNITVAIEGNILYLKYKLDGSSALDWGVDNPKTLTSLSVGSHFIEFYRDSSGVKSTSLYRSFTVNQPTGNVVSVNSFTSNPLTIDQGQTALLSWDVIFEDSTKINGQMVQGSYLQVSPTVTTVYTLTAYGFGGPVTAQVTVTVNVPGGDVSIVSFTADRTSITVGDTVTFSWSTSNADSVKFDGTKVSASGSVKVVPTASKAYLLIVYGNNGPKTGEVDIIVNSSGVALKAVRSGTDIVLTIDLTIVNGADSVICYPQSSAPTPSEVQSYARWKVRGEFVISGYAWMYAGGFSSNSITGSSLMLSGPNVEFTLRSATQVNTTSWNQNGFLTVNGAQQLSTILQGIKWIPGTAKFRCEI
ncbi:MAG: hypothetical protein V1707_02845 [bacterium]